MSNVFEMPEYFGSLRIKAHNAMRVLVEIAEFNVSPLVTACDSAERRGNDIC